MSESPRSSFSVRDVLVRWRRWFPWIKTGVRDVRPDPRAVAAERTRGQVGVIRRELRDRGAVAAAAPEGPVLAKDDADAAFLFRPGVALVRDDTPDRRYYQEFLEFFGARSSLFEGREPVRRDDVRLPEGLVLVEMPSRTDRGDEVLKTLEEIDDDRRSRNLTGVVAQPDHILYVTVQGHYCPATEPVEPSVAEPLPAPVGDGDAGRGVRVAVVDTGLWMQATTSHDTPWLAGVEPADSLDVEDVDPNGMHEYAGHGTFVTGVIRCLAPASEVRVEGALPHGGAAYESAICEQLHQALTEQSDPQLVSISAGTYTRANMGLLGFEILAENHGLTDGTKGLVVAAAGNDSSAAPFYPAAFPWVVGVGALDEEGFVAPYSNYGPWVDVWARGTNLVNAFPEGTYTCTEPPNKGQQRVFKHLAQWSGTSFSTPVVTGAIAAHMSASGNTTDPQKAFDELTAGAAVCKDSKAAGKKHVGPL